MQAAEKQTVSLRAIDGRLANLQIVARHADSPASAGTASALIELLDAAGCGVSAASRVADDASTDSHLAFESDLPGIAGLDGITVTRLRSFYPVVRSQLPGLDLALLSAASPAIDDATIDAACLYARRFGRHQIDVVPPSQGVAQVVEDIDRRLDAWRERYPDLEFSTVPVARLIGEFAAGKGKVDVVVAPPVFADILAEVAGVMSGAASLATHSHFHRGRITVSANDKGHDVVPAAGMILAVADLLVWLGRSDASGRLIRGWARTLEHGCHTPEFRVMSPYSSRLDAEAFIAVVGSRLDDTPRTLDLQQPGKPSTTKPATGRHLRLVAD